MLSGTLCEIYFSLSYSFIKVDDCMSTLLFTRSVIIKNCRSATFVSDYALLMIIA